MKSTKTKPLTGVEINEGLKRLMSSALMRASDFNHAADLTAQFRCADVDRSFSALAECIETRAKVTCVIFDLAVALVTSRLTESEVFRLGTSEEAMQLFEATCEEWNDQRRLVAEATS